MKKYLEWRDLNACRAYPLETREIPTQYILDAVFFLDPRVFISYFKVQGGEGHLILNNLFEFKGSGLVENLYGRILFGDLSKEFYLQETPVFMLDSVCYPQRSITIENLSNVDVFISNPVTGKSNEITLPTSTEFTYDCVQSVNGVTPSTGHLVLQGDDCTSILHTTKHLLTIEDICLPLCYDCNDRITEGGDVYCVITQLEERVDDLEGLP